MYTRSSSRAEKNAGNLCGQHQCGSTTNSSSYLEDTSNDAPQNIFFDGWWGLGASAVLRAIAEQPPPSLREKFDKIIHIDCSIWKSRRQLQRVIMDEIKLTHQLAADLDRQDEEDDFSGVDQGSRAEIRDITGVIGRYLVQYRCLVIFHNGSSSTVDLASFGIPLFQFLGTKVLWTFRGRLRLNRELSKRVDSSHLFLYANDGYLGNPHWDAHLAEDAREIALHTHRLRLGIAPEIATKCCLYLLSLNNQGKKKIDYKWEGHASSYWVCDGIIGGGQENKTWDVAHALQRQIRLEDYSSYVEKLNRPLKQWICITKSYLNEVPPETTTLFFAPDKSTPRVVSLARDMFHKADQLRVLKLCGCTFSFSSPPFHCCSNVRFLGLDTCKDEVQPGEEEEKKTTCEPAVEIFQRLWVLDVCHTDWPLAFPLETENQVVAEDIREVHITNGRIWRSNLAWRRLPSLHKLRVVEPTNPWETEGIDDEFMDMVNLELLDLSGNNTIQILPSLSSATSLKTLVLDACVGLEHVGPQQLPPSLESFSLMTPGEDEDHKKKAKISYICLAGCARLANFILRGSLPKLEELDLSHTAVKMLDLGKVVEVENLRRIFLMGCGQLRSISWPNTEMYGLRLLCIDTRSAGEVANRKPWLHDCSLMVYQQDETKEYCHASIAIADMRFLQSLQVLEETIPCGKWNLCLSSTSNDDGSRSYHKDKTDRSSTRRLAAALPSLPKSSTYHDVVSTDQISRKIDVINSSSSTQFLPLDLHMEIGEGIRDVTDKANARARDAIGWVMNRVQSLHVYDSSSISNIAPQHNFIHESVDGPVMNVLKWCRVERCPKLDTVFDTNYYWSCFSDLEIFSASHLLMARSIWSRPRNPRLDSGCLSFKQLRAIHLHYCPRLQYVLPMASNNTLSKVLETLHIHCCGDLRQVFLVEQEFLAKIAASHHEKSMLGFPNLKSLYLYEFPKLQQICEAKLFAPKLETIYIRGCWGLRRLPATDTRRRKDGRPVAVDCEKDWWDKLKWDGMESGHHPSLFEPSHSRYYKRRHLRVSVLR